MVALAGVADIVTAQRADRRVVACPASRVPPTWPGERWTPWRPRSAGPLPLEVRIEKGIPAQAGLGGGSSDAAATLVAADRIHGLGLGDEGLERVAAEVGSDVPFFVRAGAQWARGRGERLCPAFAPAFTAVLAKAPGGLSTAAVYAAFDRLPPPAPVADGAPPHGLPALAGWVRNDLWPAALALQPSLGATARALSAAGAEAVLLCGSGSCLAGLFPGRAAATAAHAGLPERWFRASVEPLAPLPR